MIHYYSPSLNSIYNAGVRESLVDINEWPEDAVELTDAEFNAIQCVDFMPGPDGKPVATTDALAQAARTKRDELLVDADYLVNMLTDKGEDTAAARAYRQALRDVPEQATFPAAVVWPVAPARQTA